MGLRAKEIREKLRGKVEPDLMHTLEALAEIQHQHEKTMTEMAGLIQMCVAATESFSMVADGMKNKLQQLERNRQDPNPDLGPVSTN